jgi:hypothetical protein
MNEKIAIIELKEKEFSPPAHLNKCPILNASAECCEGGSFNMSRPSKRDL